MIVSHGEESSTWPHLCASSTILWPMLGVSKCRSMKGERAFPISPSPPTMDCLVQYKTLAVLRCWDEIHVDSLSGLEPKSQSFFMDRLCIISTHGLIFILMVPYKTLHPFSLFAMVLTHFLRHTRINRRPRYSNTLSELFRS